MTAVLFFVQHAILQVYSCYYSFYMRKKKLFANYSKKMNVAKITLAKQKHARYNKRGFKDRVAVKSRGI